MMFNSSIMFEIIRFKVSEIKDTFILLFYYLYKLCSTAHRSRCKNMISDFRQSQEWC